MHDLLYVILVPAVMGLFPLLIPRKGFVVAGIVSLVTAGWVFYRSILLFGGREIAANFPLFNLGGQIPFDFALRLTGFSSFVLLFIMLFGVLIILYSL
ncbi:MAG TPA: hypothetical protein VLA34_00995, partial [Candidatus Krumholzibacterium sp.]|nr:hypothetical protein [Candidatus Krumholzibacterium sp.]